MKSSLPASETHTLKLRIFNPSRLSDEELETSFTVHLKLFEKLLGRIINEKKGHVPQHHLIVGQRGMGKTTLLCRIAVELRKPEYRKQYMPLQFPEEQYIEIDRLSKLWLNCLDALADALEEEGDSVAAKELDAKIHSLNYSYMNEREVARKAQKLFEKTAQTSKRRPVLLFDNFHLILDRLREEDYTLRAFFMREDAPILIGASTVMPGDTSDYGAAFYDAFMIHLLHRLSLQEMQSVLRRLAENSGNAELLTKIQSEAPRLATLRDLTGGNPRTTVLLFELFARGFSKDAYEDLESLLDHMTPLYQSRFDQLSEQSQLVLSALARNWSPASAQQLTKLTSLPRGSISTQLNRLEAIGMVEKVELSKGKKPGYQVAERFFNIWYLMRFAARRERNGLVFLTRFLQEFYTPVELNQRAFDLMKKGQLSEGERTYAMALTETGLDATTTQKLHAYVNESPHFYGKAKTVRQASSENNLKDSSLGGLISISKEKAEAAFLKAIEVNPNNVDTWNAWGCSLGIFGRYEEAVEKFKKAASLDPKNVDAWYYWGFSLFILGHYEEAIEKYEKAVDLDPAYSSASYILAFLYRDFMDNPQQAQNCIQEFEKTGGFVQRFADTAELQKMLFASHEQNWGQVKQHLIKALRYLDLSNDEELRSLYIGDNVDWYWASAVLLHQGYGVKLVKFLGEEGWNIRLMPWVEAIHAHSLEDRRHLLDIPQESREVTGIIYDEIAKIRQHLPESTRNLFI